MAVTVYTYSVSLDTANGICDPESLKQEVNAEGGISEDCDGVDTDGDVLHVTMSNSLDAAEQTLLDGVVSAHQGVPPDPADYTELTVDRTTTSNTFDGTLVSLVLNKQSADTKFQIDFRAHVGAAHDNKGTEFKVFVDSVEQTSYGTKIQSIDKGNGGAVVLLRGRISGLAAGDRTVEIRWRVTPGDSTTLYCEPATNDFDFATLSVEEF